MAGGGYKALPEHVASLKKQLADAKATARTAALEEVAAEAEKQGDELCALAEQEGKDKGVDWSWRQNMLFTRGRARRRIAEDIRRMAATPDKADADHVPDAGGKAGE